MDNSLLLAKIKEGLESSIKKCSGELFFTKALVKHLKTDLERLENHKPDPDENIEEYLMLSSYQLQLRNQICLCYLSKTRNKEDGSTGTLKELYDKLDENKKRLLISISFLDENYPTSDTSFGTGLCEGK